MKTIDGYDVKIFTDNIEQAAIDQIKMLLSIDVFSDRKIRIMPDVHAGAGCVIGFTGDLGDKVIPNIVGVDIGCGMRVLELGRIGDFDFHDFHRFIRDNIPSGKNIREDRSFKPLAGEETDLYRQAGDLLQGLCCYRDLKDPARLQDAIGTLGGGNHFIELDKDDADGTYLVIHTGSRNLGFQVANIYQAQAVRHLTEGADDFEARVGEVIARYKASGRETELQGVMERMRTEQKNARTLLPAELCYVEGEARERYLHDMRICQRWAALNRRLISMILLRFFPEVRVKSEFESVHNYISDDNLIRKGAISAADGERCVIPLNMRDGSLLCTGKGNADWNCSAPHGAGRILSRSQACEAITMEDFKASMKGIYSECVVETTRDESPMAYKPASEIIANIGDTVSIDTVIRPVFNFKAT